MAAKTSLSTEKLGGGISSRNEGGPGINAGGLAGLLADGPGDFFDDEGNGTRVVLEGDVTGIDEDKLSITGLLLGTAITTSAGGMEGSGTGAKAMGGTDSASLIG